MNIRELVDRFAEGVARQSDAIAAGDAKVGNEYAKRYIEAFGELRAVGDAGRDALARLFEHPRADVRVMAAAFLLRYRHAEARRLLEEEAKGTGMVAFGAAQALKRWQEGVWALDPE